MKTREKKAKAKTIIEQDRALVNNALKGYLNKLKGPGILCKAMRYTVFSGGKRLRPILTVESCKALNGDAKKALPLACAVELVHNFSLIHDDLPAMDNDDIRRGRLTCHKKFGEGLAILAGDALLNLAFGILAKLKHKKAREAASLLSDAIGVESMIGGQALDLKYAGNRKRSSKLSDKIDSMKTAALIAVSCGIGAVAAMAKARDVKKMYEFGMDLGLAFQIADDIKDTLPEAKALSRMEKKAKSFISRGKRHIASFKEKTDTLRYIADGVLERR